MMQRKTIAAAVLAATSALGLGTAAHAVPAVVAVQSPPVTQDGWEYRPSQWVQRSDGSWYLTSAEWVRRDNYAYNRHDEDRAQRRWERRFGPNGDLDRDGVLNQDDRDRDGDGVRNRYDRYPNDADRD